MKLAFVFILTFLQFAQVGAQSHPVPVLPDTSQYGRYTSRTMHLLQNSTPERPNTVKILVYGQSISAQKWWLEVKKDIEKKFPHANLIMENKSIGGFASQLLCKTVEMDVSSFYPDLVLLHIYGNDKMYDSVLHTIRSRTAAEVAIQTDHYTGANKWSDTMSYHILPELALKYKCDLINIRDPWKQYLRDNNLDTSKLLSDAVHLNDFGNYLMAELIKPLFTFKSKFKDDPFELVTKYIPGKDFKLKNMEFDGNRVDFVLGNVTQPIEIYVDGKKPSDFQGTYYRSRPTNNNGEAWPWNLPAMIRISHTAPWISEDWFLKYTEAKPPYNDFSYEIWGSVTGKEGSGKGSQDFISPSGRIIIHKGDAEEGGEWHLKRSYKVLKTTVNEGDTIHWKTFSISTDKIDSTMSEKTVTIYQGLTNKVHSLKLHAIGKKMIPIKEVVVYRPFIRLVVFNHE
jgi:hypothetical protein